MPSILLKNRDLITHLQDHRFWSILGLIISVSFGLLTVGCGGHKADSNAPQLSSEQVKTRPGLQEPKLGTFIDSAVSGLFYRTETQQGFTDHNGQFSYLNGETISFSIGNIQLGSAPAAALMTPASLSNSPTDHPNSKTINILRILQTLDDDGDPSNGISISDNAHLVASRLAKSDIDITLASAELEKHPKLLELIRLSTNLSTLVSSDSAHKHFQQSMQLLQ